MEKEKAIRIKQNANKKALWVMVSPDPKQKYTVESFIKFIEGKLKNKYIDHWWYTLEWRVTRIPKINNKNVILPKGLHAHIFLYYNNRYAKQHFKSLRNKNFKMVSVINNKPKDIGIKQWEKECKEYVKHDGIHKKKFPEDWYLKKQNDIIFREYFKVPHFVDCDTV